MLSAPARAGRVLGAEMLPAGGGRDDGGPVARDRVAAGFIRDGVLPSKGMADPEWFARQAMRIGDGAG